MVKYEGKRIEVTKSAAEELLHLGKTLFDVKIVLEEGYDAPRKRSGGKIERWLERGNKTYNAVIASGYNEIVEEEVWLFVHFGRFSRK